MNTNNNTHIRALAVFFVICTTVLGACDMVGDLEENPKSFASPSNFYNNPGQIEGVFAASMDEVWGYWETGYDWSLILCFQNTDQFDGGNLVIEANHCSHMWEDHFRNIANLNYAIASIEQGRLEGISQTTRDELMGQAKMLRGWNYFQLVRMFGGLPILTEDDTEDYFSLEPSRSSVEEVYSLIVSDFQAAIEQLPANWSSDLSGRPTSAVAKAFLAKAYLTMATAPLNQDQYYQNAADLTREIMESGRYSLVEDVDRVFSFPTESGPEMMWTFQSNAQDRSISPQVWSDINGWGDQTAQDVWVEDYPEQPRKNAYLELTDAEGNTWKDLGQSPGIKKYLYDDNENIAAGRSFINLPIMRYADVLLMFAEADNMANGGPTQAAVDAVNRVIDRANGWEENPNHPRLSMSMSQEQFDEAVIQERNLELCFEYDRWFDIVRKRILDEVSRPEIMQNFSEDDYLFPIPESELRLNDNMTQNPGY